MEPGPYRGCLLASFPEHLAGKAPSIHASQHAAGGSDPVTLTTSQVTGLDTKLSEIDASLSNKAEWNGGNLQSVSILEWAENRGINAADTHVSANDTVTNMPYASFWAVDFNSYPHGGWIELVATDVQAGTTWINVKNWQQPWSGWVQIATATPPQEYDLPLAAGWTGTIKYFRTQENVVTVHGEISKAGGIVAYSVFSTLPIGFRPDREFCVPATSQTDMAACAIRVSADNIGNLQCTDVAPNTGNVCFAFSYLATPPLQT